jgi:hypothetical protein
VALLAAVLSLAAAPRAAAQDTHHWAIQYGPVGQLVGGQVIGGVADLSATFYHPGALSLRNESSYLLSTESVQWEVLTTNSQPGLEVLDRGQRRRSELSAQAVAPEVAALAVSGVSDIEYSHYRTLAKLGVAWQTPEWNAGVSVTTASLGAFGSGKAAYTLSLAGTDRNGDGIPDPPVLETWTEEGLDSDYRSPWAVGAGVSKRVVQTRLYASAEWYGRVHRFTVMLGASWALGGKDRPLESPIPPEDVPVPGFDQDISIRYSKVTFLLGFVFGS